MQSNVPKVSEETKRRWNEEIALKVQKKLERSSKQDDWAERLEAAARDGGLEEAEQWHGDGGHAPDQKADKKAKKKSKHKDKDKTKKRKRKHDSPGREEVKKRGGKHRRESGMSHQDAGIRGDGRETKTALEAPPPSAAPTS